MSELIAARIDDPLVHSSLLSDLVSGVVEGAIYGGILFGAGLIASSGIGLAVGVALTIGAMASGYPEKIGNMAGEAVDGLLDMLGMRGPPDAVITSGSDNVHIMGKPAARAAGTVDHGWLNAAAPDGEKEPGLLDSAMAMAAGIAAAVSHPGAAASTLLDKVSHINGDAVKHFFSGLYDDLVQPTVATASPHATPASQDTVVCSKGHQAGFLAEGSKKVLINGHPAARNGDRSTCEAKIQVSEHPRVNIGGDSIVVRDIRSGKNALAYFIGGLLGGGIGKEGAELLEQLFSRVAARRALRQISCIIASNAAGEAAGGIATQAIQSAHPVNYATGAKILADQDDLDFVLEDRIPLYWQRIYNSRNLTSGMLGTGWMMPFETRLIRFRHEDGTLQFLWRDISGQALGLGEITPGDVVHFDEEGFTLYCSLQGVIIMQTAQGEFHLYEADPHREGEWRIRRIYDRHENSQHFSWNDAGQLVGIAGDNEALDVRLSYEPLHGRLVAVHQVVDGGHRLLVRYGYNSQGQLTDVHDADGIETRRFSWDRASDLLASHSYASGLTVEYQWQPSIDPRYWRVYEFRVLDDRRECLEHWLIDADEQARSATVTCFSGGTTVHRWDALYRITDYTDSYGAHWSYRWAEQGDLLMATHAPGGRVWEYGYDERARLTMVRDPAGRTTITSWHPSYAFPLKEVLPDGAVWQYQYNAAGDVVAVTDPLGGTTRFSWNGQGDLLSRTDALENTHRFWWNSRGQIQREEDCSGNQSHRQYDGAGRLIVSTDAEGNTTRYQWSEAGRLRGVTRTDGRETRYEYDLAGRLTGENIDGFSERKVTRNIRGQIVAETDPAGHLTRYQYDRFGRLIALINPNNERWQFEYDNSQRLLAQTDYAGRRRSYRYDALGHVAEVTQYPLNATGENLAPHTTQFEYDVVNRLTAKMTALNRTEYHYHPDKVEVRKMSLADWQQALAGGYEVREVEILSLTYDALGNLLSEENHGGVFSHQYDALGNLSRSTLPDGLSVNCLRYGTGHLLQVNLQQGSRLTEIAGYQRDRLHREVGRTQGLLNQQTRYDPAGRVVMRRSGFEDRRGIVFERRYHWDRLDQVMQQRVMDSASNQQEWAQQQQRFGYDAVGQVTREVRLYKEEHFSWDAAGNQTDKPGQIVWHNLLQRLRGARWAFDGFGRMVWRKSGPDAVEQHFSYDDEHRVVEVRFEGHPAFSRVEYRYDVLGRRTHKILHRHGKETETVTFLWSGLRMVGESSSATPERHTRYLYSEGSWEPIARVDSLGDQSETLWYHTELNGLPQRMTNERGEVVWRGRFSTWGETERETSSGFQSVPQNLRFQGQYLDRETGLHYNLFRYYDPVAGRFTQPDPVGLAGGINTYAYVPNPLGWVDPWGLSKCSLKSEIKELDPKDIRFSQSSVNGAAVLTHSMKTKGWAGDPVDVVRMSDGKLTTIDNTRILAASRAGIKVQARIHEGTSSLPKEFVERFTTKKEVPSTWQDAINLRIGKQASGYRNGYPNGSVIIGSLD
ncbi:RHS repeat-associated core domain-containing protein [Erwinia endophytica]|uniref:RHS repeat-associated core domain-containing protein n=1 Tax=Erwinia endophytica TaxID=1563158 RepID=UPI00186B6FC9|nr:RHS repeat-associated core domain-containing protein [Erwinia endophytica]